MTVFAPIPAEKEQVVLSFPEIGVELKEFTDYEFNSNFLTPTDAFYFTVASPGMTDMLSSHIIVPGTKAQLTINGGIQATGYIDSIECNADRRTGSVWHICGRDLLAQAVDANADPTNELKPTQTLEDALVSLFGTFGWSTPDQFLIANDANRNVQSGSSRGTPMTRGGKKKAPKPLKSYTLHQTHPYYREGVFAFASRISQRFGLWIWLTADGTQLIVDRPNFDQPATYKLFRSPNGPTNVLEGSVKFDVSEQPTVIVADGSSGGGEFGRSPIRAITANTAVFTDDTSYLDPWKKYASAKRVDGHSFATPVHVPRSRVMYLHDSESQTLEQLENFLRREVALLMRKTLTVHYTVQGHGQQTEGGFKPWAVDTTVDIDDQLAGLKETMYVLSRTFRKSRSEGTTTHLELIRLNTINFGDPPEPAPQGANGSPKLQADISQGHYHEYVEQIPSLDTAPRRKTK